MNQDPNVIIGPVSFQGFKFKLYGSMTYLKASTSHCQPCCQGTIASRRHNEKQTKYNEVGCGLPRLQA